jgi:hypothetical protein
MFRELRPAQLADFARLAAPHAPRLDAALRRRLKPCDARRIKALSPITSGAAAPGDGACTSASFSER